MRARWSDWRSKSRDIVRTAESFASWHTRLCGLKEMERTTDDPISVTQYDKTSGPEKKVAVVAREKDSCPCVKKDEAAELTIRSVGNDPRYVSNYNNLYIYSAKNRQPLRPIPRRGGYPRLLLASLDSLFLVDFNSKIKQRDASSCTRTSIAASTFWARAPRRARGSRMSLRPCVRTSGWSSGTSFDSPADYPGTNTRLRALSPAVNTANRCRMKFEQNYTFLPLDEAIKRLLRPLFARIV